MKTNNFPTVELTKEQKQFLTGYKPENEHYTSWDEVEKVKSFLNLDDLYGNMLQAMRNTIVCFYHELTDKLMNGDGSWTNEAFDTWNAMQSVTAVIDDVKYRRGMEI